MNATETEVNTARGNGGRSAGKLAAYLREEICDGRIPAAFSVGGTLEKPLLAFDVDRTADAIAASGAPQAVGLLKGLSRSEKDQIARAVEKYLAGANRN